MAKDIYVGRLVSKDYLSHYGRGHDDSPPGRGSGRYPWGSGVRGKQRMAAGRTGASSGKTMDTVHRISHAITLGAAAVTAVTNPASFLTVVGVTRIPGIAISGKYAADNVYARYKNAKISARKETEVTDKSTGFKKKSGTYTKEEDCRNVNPLYKTHDSDKSHNCIYCTVAYDLRRKGYDVTAKPSYNAMENRKLLDWYPKADFKFAPRSLGNNNGTFSKDKYVDTVINDIVKQGDGARGNLVFSWDYPIISTSLEAGHSVAYEVDKGKLLILDCQSGKTYGDPAKYLRHTNDIGYARLDNVKFDKKKIKECCQ